METYVLKNMLEALSALCAVEMALCTSLNLNTQGDYVEGYEDYGKHGHRHLVHPLYT